MARLSTVITATGTGNYTVPDHVHKLYVWTKAAAAGTTGSSNGLYGGTGSGGGGLSYQEFVVNPGDIIPYSNGVGGAGGAAAGVGAAGGDTWFKSTSDLLAKGAAATSVGLGGTGVGGTTAGAVGAIKFAGGSGAAQNGLGGGAGGGAAGDNGAGGNATSSPSVAGAGGAGLVGGQAGVAGAARTGTTGLAGTAPGGGASGPSGSGASRVGVKGGDGEIRIEYDLDDTISDNAGITDSLTSYVIAFNPTGLINDAYDMKFGTAQAYRVFRGTTKVWDWITPYPFSKFLTPSPGFPFRWVVPDGCYYLDYAGGGARAGDAPPSTGGLGGIGGEQSGRVLVGPGDIIEGYVGRRGSDGTQVGEPYGRGGEPGGACPQLNVFLTPYDKMGGAGGGLTSIYVNSVLKVQIGAGGGGGTGMPGGAIGGKGGDGGGLAGQDGGNGLFTLGASGREGEGGTAGDQTDPGLGGSSGSASNSSGDGWPGADGAGGTTYRSGTYGTGAAAHPTGGGGGAGYKGGGGGGNGSNALGAGDGGGGGGGGGSSFADSDVILYTNTRGTNPNDHGYLVFSFYAKRTYKDI